MKHKIFIVLLTISSTITLAQESKKEESRMDKMWGTTSVINEAQKDGRTKFFDESNFGMFVHWGLFSNLGGVWEGKTYYGIGEWIMNRNMANIPADKYKKIASSFNPTGFDAKSIAKLAKDAGMKYIVITSKHHEGFAMFKSQVDSFNIVDATPFARDPMKELSAACHELGLGFGFYYSHNQDWTAPGGYGGPKTNSDGSEVTFENYFYKKCLPQVKEICTNYGQIDFVWFDTPGSMKKELVIELANTVRKLQPKAMMCSRVGYGMGDYASLGDMEVPPRNVEGLWETCDTNNDSWSYAWYDNNFKSPKEILHRLISTIGRGGSYLFNVGPNSMGKIPEIGAKFLEETGSWIKRYPQVIYKAGCSPWGHALQWGDVTTQGKSMFLCVFDWPQSGRLYLPGLKSKIISAEILQGGKKVKVNWKSENGWVVFDLPSKPADSPVSVIELQLDVDAKNAIVNSDLAIDPEKSSLLIAEFANVTLANKKNIGWMEKFGEWKHITQIGNWVENSKATWSVNVNAPGYYYINLRYKGVGKLVWRTVTDENVVVQNQQAATEKYQAYPMGIMEFKTAGSHTISVNLVEGDPNTSSLDAVIFEPIEK
jgi:alpha-L-fucosidase